jgi:hypothetical protein
VRKTDPMTSCSGHSRLDQPFPRAAQMDDMQCFVRGFHTKYVADIQKLAEVGDLFIVIRSEL